MADFSALADVHSDPFVFGLVAFYATVADAGTLDPTFDIDGRANVHIGQYSTPKEVFILPDGKILVAGETAQVGFHLYLPSPELARYNSDGTLDTSFGSNGIVPGQFGNVQANDVLLQPDGKIVFVGGVNPAWNAPPQDFAIVRYNSNGTLDGSFGFGGFNTTSIGGSRDTAYAAVLLPDGKYLVFGGTDGTTGSPGALDIVRYNSNGSLDGTFGFNGVVFYIGGAINTMSAFTDAILLSDGKILVNGYQNGDFTARINPDGSFDNSYGISGFVYNPRASGKMTLLPNGSFIVANSFLTGNFTFELTKFKTDGSIDTSFGTNGVVKTNFRTVSNHVGYMEANVYQVVPKSNGDIIAVGLGHEFSSGPYYFAASQYDSGGSLLAKTTFSFPAYTDARGRCAAIQPDGRIVIVGSSEASLGGNDLAVARLTNITNDPQPYKRRYNFNGTTVDNYIVYRPGTGGESGVFFNYNGQSISPQFGIAGDVLAPADYNDDGKADLAFFRPSNGTWYIATLYSNPANNFIAIPWGTSGDIPAAADYDGDGNADVAVFRPSTGYWYIRNSHDGSMTAFQWGTNGDKPVVGDYDGDAKADVAVFRPSSGYWYILRSSDNQFSAIQFGLATDILVQADYNGDFITDIAVFRPSTGTWYTSTNPANNYGAFQFGLGTDIPVPGDYDADNKSDLAVWRPSNRTWYILKSSNGTVSGTQWGASTDIPVPGN